MQEDTMYVWQHKLEEVEHVIFGRVTDQPLHGHAFEMVQFAE